MICGARPSMTAETPSPPNDWLYSLHPTIPSSVLILRKSKFRCPASACSDSTRVIFMAILSVRSFVSVASGRLRRPEHGKLMLEFLDNAREHRAVADLFVDHLCCLDCDHRSEPRRFSADRRALELDELAQLSLVEMPRIDGGRQLLRTARHQRVADEAAHDLRDETPFRFMQRAVQSRLERRAVGRGQAHRYLLVQLPPQGLGQHQLGEIARERLPAVTLRHGVPDQAETDGDDDRDQHPTPSARCHRDAHPTWYRLMAAASKARPRPGRFGTTMRPFSIAGPSSKRRSDHGMYSTVRPFGTAATSCTWISGRR